MTSAPLNTTYLRRQGRVKTPKSQRSLAGMIRRLLDNTVVEVEITWPWLTTEQGSKMYCDIYVPAYNLIVEYMGYQHYRFPNRFHTELDAFRAQKARDKRKKDLVEAQGLTYIAWHYQESLTEKHTSERLTEAGITVARPGDTTTIDYSLANRRTQKRQRFAERRKRRRLHAKPRK